MPVMLLVKIRKRNWYIWAHLSYCTFIWWDCWDYHEMVHDLISIFRDYHSHHLFVVTSHPVDSVVEMDYPFHGPQLFREHLDSKI